MKIYLTPTSFDSNNNNNNSDRGLYNKDFSWTPLFERPCPSGFYIAKATDVHCDIVGPGFSSPEGVNDRFPCAAGQFAAGDTSGECQDCFAGSYSGAPQASSCQPCPVGEFNMAPGSASCEPCSPDLYDGYASDAAEWLEPEQTGLPESGLFCLQPEDGPFPATSGPTATSAPTTSAPSLRPSPQPSASPSFIMPPSMMPSVAPSRLWMPPTPSSAVPSSAVPSTDSPSTQEPSTTSPSFTPSMMPSVGPSLLPSLPSTSGESSAAPSSAMPLTTIPVLSTEAPTVVPTRSPFMDEPVGSSENNDNDNSFPTSSPAVNNSSVTSKGKSFYEAILDNKVVLLPATLFVTCIICVILACRCCKKRAVKQLPIHAAGKKVVPPPISNRGTDDDDESVMENVYLEDDDIESSRQSGMTPSANDLWEDLDHGLAKLGTNFADVMIANGMMSADEASVAAADDGDSTTSTWRDGGGGNATVWSVPAGVLPNDEEEELEIIF